MLMTYEDWMEVAEHAATELREKAMVLTREEAARHLTAITVATRKIAEFHGIEGY